MNLNYEVRPNAERLPNWLMVIGLISNEFEEMADFVMNCVMRWVYDLDSEQFVDDPIKCVFWIHQQIDNQGAHEFFTQVYAAIAEYKQQLDEAENCEEMPESLVNQINELLGDES